jgi:carboxyl-terminal processing protease
MRNNPGGLLDQAIEISDLFLEQGTIVTTVGLKNKMRDSQVAQLKNTQPIYPMVVLVNEGSASASEIVAGALQRNQRAIVLGQKTFGKGTVQTLYDLPQKSALKLTVAKYLTPGDISIQSIGIVPDIQTVPVVIDKEQITFFYSEEEHGEAELERHFTSADQKTLKMEPQASIEYYFPKPTPEEMEKEYSFSRLSFEGKQKRLLEDFETKTAFDILKLSTSSSQNALIEAAKKELILARKAQEGLIATAMQKQGIDWSYSPTAKTQKDCKEPEVSFMVLPANPDASIYAGDKIEVQAIMKNSSPCILYQAKATSKSESSFFDHREVFFGKLNPNQSVMRKIPLTVPQYQAAGAYAMSFKFENTIGINPKDQNVMITVLPNKQPVFSFEYDISDQIENQTGFLATNTPERGEKFYLNLKIKNIGEVSSKETFISIKQDGDKTLQFDKAREKLEQFAPNQERSVKFLVEVPQKFDEPSFKLVVAVSDMDYQSFIQKKIDMKLFQAKIAEPKEQKMIRYFQEPTISLNNIAALTQMQAGTATFNGIIKDDVQVQDMYIMVNGKKATYHGFENKKKLEPFNLSVPLKKGKNEIIIVARDDQDLVQTLQLTLMSN